jgi:uncharacterized protein (DUF2147 family)
MRAMLNTRTLTLAAAGIVIWSLPSHAATDATGIWYDHNGRGAVEIAPCGSGKGLCGYVIHIKDEKNASRCGTQILGNVTPSGGGWIYSPDRGRKYSVELTRLSDDKLRVVGNAGSLFSKTFTWKRAPDDVARCGETTAAAPSKPAETTAAAVEPQTVRETAVEPSTTRSLGASSASMALIGSPKKQKRTEVVPVAAPADATAEATPAVTKEAAPAKADPAPAKTADAPAPVEDTEEFVPERKCKYKIPYVGRVISVPCRD